MLVIKSLKNKIHDTQRDHQYSRTPRRRFNQTRDNCRRNKMQFLLTLEEFIFFCEQPCFYCKSVIDATGAGLDRVDNTIGYVITNVVTCCFTCNRMKATQTFDMFLNQVRTVYKNMLAKGFYSPHDI